MAVLQETRIGISVLKNFIHSHCLFMVDTLGSLAELRLKLHIELYTMLQEMQIEPFLFFLPGSVKI